MLGAARRSVRRVVVNKNVPLPAAVLERTPSTSGTKNEDDGRDGTLWTGYASGWIFDGTKGFYERQPGFMKMRVRC